MQDAVQLCCPTRLAVHPEVHRLRCFSPSPAHQPTAMLQSVIKGIDYVRQQRNDVMHTLGVFRLQAS